MDSKGTGYIVGGIVALVLLNKLFNGGPGSWFKATPDEAAVTASAAEFDNPSAMPELYEAGLLFDQVQSGAVTSAQITASQGRAGAIGAAVVSFYNSKGVVWDNEENAVSAVGSLRSWVDLLVFTGTMQTTFSVTPGAYGKTFLSEGDKAAIVRIVKNLRNK